METTTIIYVIASVLLVGVLVYLATPRKGSNSPHAFSSSEIAEAGVAVALAIVLSLIRVYRMPQGGSVSLEMVPIFYIALRRGARAGIAAGLVLGLAKLAIEPYIVHPVQLIMDYPLPFALLGVAGFMRKSPALGVIVGGFLRFIVHVLSGVIFFASYAGEQNVWVYSLVYNGTYLLPEVLVSLVVMVMLFRSRAGRLGDR